MRSSYSKLTALILVLTAGLLLFLPMRFGQEDHLYANPGTLKLRLGDSVAITYELDSDHAQAITYTAVDESIATVNSRGVVKAIHPGNTDIRMDAEDGAKTIVHVEVLGVPTTRIQLNTDSLRMEKGQVTGLTAAFNEGADDTRLEWRSENPEIAQVDAVGRVTALQGGQTTVYAITPGGLRADASVFVHVSGSAMRITPENLTVGTGATLDMNALYLPDDTTDTIDRWISSNESLLTVDRSGTIKALQVGKPVLTVYSREGLSSSAVINVERSSERFVLSPSTATIERGDTLDLQTLFLDASGNIDNASSGHYIQWQSSNPEIATVDSVGHVEALKSGQATISAVVDGMTAACDLRVQVLVHEITLNENEIYMLPGATGRPIQLIAQIRPTDPDDPTITWLTSNDLIANVDANGLVTMTGAFGTAIITARAVSGAEAHFTVSVVTELPDRETAQAIADARAESERSGH